MISSYRLGDLILWGLDENEKNEMLIEHPSSFGSEYIKNNSNNILSITNIVNNNIHKYVHLFPKDIENSTVIHLRLGDVIAGTQIHEQKKRPLSIDYLKSVVPSGNVYIIGKPFFAKPSSTNYSECIELSNIYLQEVIQSFNAVHFDSGNADIDLCFAVKCKTFVQGKGFFSKLITEIRKGMGLTSIETSPE